MSSERTPVPDEDEILFLPPELQSDSESVPEPAPSPYEAQVEEQRRKSALFDAIEAEVEAECAEMDESQVRRIDSMRRRDMNDCLDGMFDDMSITERSETDRRSEASSPRHL